MDIKTLMANDWIHIAPLCAGRADYYSQVAYLSPNAVFYRCDKLNLFAEEERVSPIPLTHEILIKNGFEANDKSIWRIEVGVRCSYSKKFGEDFMCYSVDIEEMEEGGWFDFGIDHCLWQGVAINYVHELQQALRLAGLKEIADNFKI